MKRYTVRFWPNIFEVQAINGRRLTARRLARRVRRMRRKLEATLAQVFPTTPRGDTFLFLVWMD